MIERNPSSTSEKDRVALASWLAAQETPGGHPSTRFMGPIPLPEIAAESGLSAEAVRALLERDPPPYHCFVARSHKSRSAPFALRIVRDSAVLDWEPSVTGAISQEFQARGYGTCLEVGTEAHIQALATNPDVSGLRPFPNQRDLAASRLGPGGHEFWFVEVVGKTAGSFEWWWFAKALAQVFDVPGSFFARMGEGRGAKDKRGHCWQIGERLSAAWRGNGFTVRRHYGVAVPYWPGSDWVWRGPAGSASAVAQWHESYYASPVEAFLDFIRFGSVPATGSHAGLAFGEMLRYLDETFGIRQLAQDSSADPALRVLRLTGEGVLIHDGEAWGPLT